MGIPSAGYLPPADRSKAFLDHAGAVTSKTSAIVARALREASLPAERRELPHFGRVSVEEKIKEQDKEIAAVALLCMRAPVPAELPAVGGAGAPSEVVPLAGSKRKAGERGSSESSKPKRLAQTSSKSAREASEEKSVESAAGKPLAGIPEEAPSKERLPDEKIQEKVQQYVLENLKTRPVFAARPEISNVAPI